MAKIETYKCDVCGTQKKESNHWWESYLLKDVEGKKIIGAQISEWEAKIVKAKVLLAPEQSTADAHLCGANCVIQYLSNKVLEQKQ